MPTTNQPATLGSATANLGQNTQAPVAAPAKAKPAKRVAKAATKPNTIKPAVVAKPAVSNERLTLQHAARKLVTQHYNGPSPTVHSSRGTKPADMLARAASPMQRIANNPTVRDGSLAVLCMRGNLSDLASYLAERGADLGGISRLASIGCLIARGDKLVGDKAKLTSCITASLGAKHVPA